MGRDETNGTDRHTIGIRIWVVCIKAEYAQIGHNEI